MSKFLFYDFSIPDLIADGNKAVGGATVQTLNWIKGLIENGHEVGVLVEKKRLESNNSAITFIETFSLSHNKIFGWIYPRPQELHRAIKSYNPDFILQAGAGFITFPIALIARLNRIPFVHRIANNADVDLRVFRKASPFAVLYFWFGILITPVISCQNDYQFLKLRKLFPRKKIIKFHNPFMATLPPTISKKEYIAWVGIFQYQKNLPLLLQVVEALPDREFKIAGTGKKNSSESIQEILAKLKNKPNVEFVGFLDRQELYPFLGQARCLLNTSYYEGFSNTFLEALAVGTPIVTTKSVDPDGIIEHFGLGKVHQDPNKLPETIQGLIGDKDYNLICETCRTYVQKNHNNCDLARMLNEWLTKIYPSSDCVGD